MAAEKAYRDQIGFEYEVDIDKRSQLERAKRKMAHIVGSGGTAFMGEELAAHAATIERLEQEISTDPEDAAGENVTAHAKQSTLSCWKGAQRLQQRPKKSHLSSMPTSRPRSRPWRRNSWTFASSLLLR